jgi:hypothetical protein
LTWADTVEFETVSGTLISADTIRFGALLSNMQQNNYPSSVNIQKNISTIDTTLLTVGLNSTYIGSVSPFKNCYFNITYNTPRSAFNSYDIYSNRTETNLGTSPSTQRLISLNVANVENFGVDNKANVLIGNGGVGTSGQKVLTIANGTAPVTSITGTQIWSDSTGLRFMTSGSTVVKTIDQDLSTNSFPTFKNIKSTNSLSIGSINSSANKCIYFGNTLGNLGDIAVPSDTGVLYNFNGGLVYDTPSNGTNAGLNILIPSEQLWSARFFNKAYSTTVAPFTFFVGDNGSAGIGTEIATSFYIYTNGYNNPRLTIDSTGKVNIPVMSTSVINRNVSLISTNTTLDAHNVISASGNITITLPSAVGISGREYIIKKSDSSATTITINTTSSQKIDGALTLSITTQYQSYTLISDSLNWMIL